MFLFCFVFAMFCACLFIYLNAKVSQPFNICVFFSMDHVRIFI